MLAMRHSDGDKMKKVLLGAVAAIAVTGAANAQVGTWYNNLAAWTDGCSVSAQPPERQGAGVGACHTHPVQTDIQTVNGCCLG